MTILTGRSLKNILNPKIDIFLLVNLIIMGLVSSVLPQAMFVMNFAIIGFAIIGLFFCKGSRQYKFLLTASLIGRREGLMVMFFPVFIWYISKKNLHKIPKGNIILVFLLLYSFALATIWIYGRFYLPFLAWLMTFSTGWFLYLGLTKKPLNNETKKEIWKFVRKVVLVEVIIGLIQYFFATIGIDEKIKSGAVFADVLMGSFGSAHVMGYFMFGVLLYFAFSLFHRKYFFSKLLSFILVFVIVLLSDAKLDILSLVITLPLMILLYFWYSGGSLQKRVLSSSLFIVLFVVAFSGIYQYYLSDIISNKRVKTTVSFYYEQEFSRKVTFFNRSIIDMWKQDPFVWVLGVGPGEMGSRANEFISNDVLDSSFKPSFDFASSWTKEYMQGLLPEGLSKEVHAKYSYALTMYYSSWLAIKSELGLIGFVLWIASMFSVVHNSLLTIRHSAKKEDRLMYGTIVYLFLGIVFNSMFDLSMEKGVLIIPLFILNSVLFFSGKKDLNHYEESVINQ